MKREQFLRQFGVDRHVVFPVIRVLSVEQTLENVCICSEMNIQGVFLINHDFPVDNFLPIIKAVRECYPALWIGVNFLGLPLRKASLILWQLTREQNVRIDGYWADSTEVNEEEQSDFIAASAARKSRWDVEGGGWQGVFFGGCACRKQRPVLPENLSRAARLSVSRGPFLQSNVARDIGVEDPTAPMDTGLRAAQNGVAHALDPPGSNLRNSSGLTSVFLCNHADPQIASGRHSAPPAMCEAVSTSTSNLLASSSGLNDSMEHSDEVSRNLASSVDASRSSSLGGVLSNTGLSMPEIMTMPTVDLTTDATAAPFSPLNFQPRDVTSNFDSGLRQFSSADVRDFGGPVGAAVDVLTTTTGEFDGESGASASITAKICELRRGCTSDHPLAVVTGASPSGVADFLEDVDCLILTTGICRDDELHYIDPSKLGGIIETVRTAAEPLNLTSPMSKSNFSHPRPRRWYLSLIAPNAEWPVPERRSEARTTSTSEVYDLSAASSPVKREGGGTAAETIHTYCGSADAICSEQPLAAKGEFVDGEQVFSVASGGASPGVRSTRVQVTKCETRTAEGIAPQNGLCGSVPEVKKPIDSAHVPSNGTSSEGVSEKIRELVASDIDGAASQSRRGVSLPASTRVVACSSVTSCANSLNTPSASSTASTAMPRQTVTSSRSSFAWCDVGRLYMNADAMQECVLDLLSRFDEHNIDLIAGIDSMGLPLAATMATRWHKGLLAVRKHCRLGVQETDQMTYEDYSGNRKVLEVYVPAFKKGTRVLLVDQMAFTGRTLETAVRLVERQGGKIAGIAALSMEINPTTQYLRCMYKCSVAVPPHLQRQFDEHRRDIMLPISRTPDIAADVLPDLTAS